MAKRPSFFFCFFMLFLCNAGIPLPHPKDSEVVWEKKQLFPSIPRALMEYFRSRMTELDSIDPPTTALPSPPMTAPPINSAPGILTAPGANPVNPPPVTNPINPPVPVTNPVNPPPVTNPVNPPPVTNPINPPVPVTNPINPPPVTNPVNPPPVTNPINPPVPVTNPVNPPPVTNPINPPVPVTNPVNPPPVTNPINPPVPVTDPVTTPSTGGNGHWCMAKNAASQAALQAALDYACGVGRADCASIQKGSSCYEPATLQNHASYAFNSYYQKNPAPTSCDFGGAATLTNTNPSTGSCVYPSSSPPSSSSSPPLTTQAPVNPTSLPTAPPTTSSSGPGTQYPPPPGFSLGNPDPTGLGAYGASPPLMNTPSVSNNLRPFIGFLVTAASVIMFGL